MDNRTDIWRHLRDHQTPPPPEVTDRLRPILHSPGNGDGEPNSLQRLQEHPVLPPSFLLSKVQKAVNIQKKGSLKWMLPYAAAACFLLVIAGIVIDRIARKPRPALAKAPSKAHPLTLRPASDTAATATTIAAPDATADSIAAPVIVGHGIFPSLTIDGDRFSLVDNNPLATFTSFKYPALTAYVSGSNKPTLRIHLDQYTNIVLSPAMTVMIKDLYGTKPNGKPTRKARKTKEKLDKWKADDDEFFNKNPSINPLDPVDLAEYLYSSPSKQVRPELQSAGTERHIPGDADLTVSYTLTIVSRRSTGIGEAYNGGIKTLFAGSSRARLRLASLMRIQSIFLTPEKGNLTVLRESGKNKTKTILTPDQWAGYNKKYAGLTCNLTPDTARILGYTCKKALITLRDGRQLTAWYTPRIRKPECSAVEPVFSNIPGLVLKYEYTCRRRTVSYTATTISRQPIDAAVFKIPAMP